MSLDLILARTALHFEAKSCTGALSVAGANERNICYTLEDLVRKDPDPSTPHNEAKVWGKTAIPAGRFRIIMRWSPKFHRIMPEITNVPGYTDILIHKGNDAGDTLGCVLVGDLISNGKIPGGTSTPAFNRLIELLEDAWADGEEIWIQVIDAFPQEAI